MSSVETRLSARTGLESHRVRWRQDGKNKAMTFATRGQAERWHAVLEAVGPERALAVLAQPEKATPTRTVAQQVASHIDHLTGVTEGTRKRYRDNMRRRLYDDPLGRIPLDLATRDDFADWVNRLAAVPLSAKTIENHHSIVSDAMRSAVRADLIPANRAEGIRIETPDTDDADEMVTLTLPELWTFVAGAPEHWRPMILFMFGTGVRWQEASALQVRDVDLAARVARINRAWKDTAGQGHQLGRPKSKKGRRPVVFGPDVADVLRPLLAGRAAEDFVFTNTRGGPVRHQNFTDQAWLPSVRKFAGDTLAKVLPPGGIGRKRHVWTPGPGKRPTPHDARHTYASLQIQRGASMAFLQRQLGHESIQTTIDTYTHLQTADLASLADVIDQPLDLRAIED
jgi:integrase